MRSKLKSRLSVLFLSLILSLCNGQYSSYSAYSTLPQQGDTLTGVSGSVSSSGNVNSVDILNKNVDLTNNAVGDGSNSVEQSQRSSQVVGYNPQAQGSHSMYYYEMYPAARAGQKCIYSGNGMKCQYRRDSGAGPTDSYLSAAAAAPSSSYGAPMMQQYGATGYAEEDDGGGDGGGGSLGGLAGLIGLLGLKGLKGLKALKPFSIFLPLIPLILPLLPILPLLLAALLIIPILFLPIPVIVGPGRRNIVRELSGANFQSIGMTSVARMASDVLESEECVERIACEISQMSKKYNASKWVERVAEFLPKNNRYVTKFYRGLKTEVKNETVQESADSARASSVDGECSRFNCKPKSIIAKHLNQ